MIVCCSWVTFLLVKTDNGAEVPARTSLGATTVLSVVTIGFGGKSKPQVYDTSFICVFYFSFILLYKSFAYHLTLIVVFV